MFENCPKEEGGGGREEGKQDQHCVGVDLSQSLQGQHSILVSFEY